MSVPPSYNLMKGFWLEMDHYQDIKMRCSDGKTIQDFVEKDRMFNFLASMLNFIRFNCKY